MAKNGNSFTPGNRKGGRAKGTPNKRTALKQALGVGTWEQVETYLTTEGAGKLIESLKELKPGQFVYAYTGLLEYFRPKLSRQQLSPGPEVETEITVTMNLTRGGG